MRCLERPARILSTIFLAFLFSCSPYHVVCAVNNNWIGPNLGNYNSNANWSVGLVPNSCCDEVATINNNTTAILSSVAPNANGLLLGAAAADVGGLRVANLGSLTTEAFSGGSNGALTIGQTGQGNLTILGGGALNGASLALAGTTASSITLGDNSGLTASLTTTGTATLGRTTTVHGKFVNFSAGGNLTLGSAGTLVGEINDATAHSPLKTTGTATLGGTFKPTFIGVTPTAGNSWNIIDAAVITGGFSTFDKSAAPVLAAGQSYQLVQANGGTNGKLLKLSVEEILTLQVNRSTHTVSIANIGTTPKSLDGYSVLSSNGSLNLANWNSLQDQAITGWVEAAGTPNDLSELNSLPSSNPSSSLTINTGLGNAAALGTPYTPQFPALGVDPDDISFEYSTSDGRIIQGSVVYTGTKVNNNLIVNVNPSTGQAQLKNDSPFTIQLDGYSVYSTSGSLQPNNGKWFSLQDRGITGWEEAPLTPPGNTAVSELNENGTLTLTSGSGYDLGELYKSIGGTQDLRLEFLQVGQDLPSTGLIVYGAFGSVPAPGLTGDYNNNGIVDAADYVIWRKKNGTGATLPNDPIGGTIGTAQYTQWRANFGHTLSGSGSSRGFGAGSVPEPSTFGLLLISVCVANAIGLRAPRRR